MPSPETGNPEIARKPTPWLPWIVLIVLVLLVVIGYLLGRPPAGPPIVVSPPAGRLYFLMVDRSSEHTAALRGLYTLGSGETKPTLLTEEQENQGLEEDAPRQWISFPRVSPDGKYLAYLSTTYLITEEKQTQTVALMVASLSPPAKPKPLRFIPIRTPAAPVGITWYGDRIVFLENGNLVRVDPATGKIATTFAMAPANAGEPSFAANGTFAYLSGSELDITSVTNTANVRRIAGVAAYALTPSGALAYVTLGQPHVVNIDGRAYPLQWAERWWYHARATSLGFSPDGSYLAYTVTNPIVPEEGLYYLRLSDGKCFRFSFSTSRASWTWTK